MGMIRDVKVKKVADEARRALEEDRWVFIVRLNTPQRLGDMTGTVGDWAEIIEAVEYEGWALAEWSVSEGPKGPAAFPLFRRRRR
ncbi:hypothetical protein I6A60_01855 [Frankia sp. AgB1.9]|uniref:hypothetical protein n=1 Tax=unclassified Frankia TaxID=2632575 RepID=UPI0019349D3C|nr:MULTISPECIES: hypothetical protein [unclassified Frankia]MBL7494458.1 hypothetical protein [Frankia sp. AgW1.1]MBL7546630.1 hypothetical protein [Frankia sp. AgB1.9]MBL7622384.1 hypothetical protein [Frankia sp. AgB1.8]